MGTYNEEIPLKQKLRIADAYIKQLKGEIGMLESEKEELEDNLLALQKEFAEFKSELLRESRLTTGEKNSVKKSIFGKKTLAEYKTMKSTIKSLKNDNKYLIEKLIREQQKEK